MRAFLPSASSRIAARFFLLCTARNSRTSAAPHPPVLLRLPPSTPRWRRFCSVGAVTTGETLGVTGTGSAEAGERVREFRKRLKIAEVKGGPSEGLDRLGERLVVNDGSCLSNMQCVLNSDVEGYDQVEAGCITSGASVMVEGILVNSQGTKQKVELKVEKLVLVGKSDPVAFPIQKKRASREFLRTIAHLRPRTNTFGAVTRVRNSLAYATHKFFQENGFVWIASPIITASDCEGAGEQFCVTTLIPSSGEDTNSPVGSIPSTKDGAIDWSQDFFGKPAFLTVSGQLNAETYATALSDVYTFGPTFRAENSNTSRHLAEFWMIEPELAFADLNDDMACATAYLQYVDIKAFYMRQNNDGKTVAAMDLLVPRVGELIGGSQREERLEYLEGRLDELKLDKESFWWYLDLRRFGSVPHAGFGLGFERLVQFATGIENIRDVIPFPRSPGSAEF
ncbi:hypothetical protein QJS10_CPA10g00886 [Acorus calamus]|uniref:Aminoacyl-transfer RNA synthetases class-II family profile domain-containing protein n=1 Tax=Acorus calamus TaxID=4465 RepID=A0AAV9DZD6_ACOCL|nr:hypothetical protein QJS10_CPA10g00886 [Acorus calamus]